MNIFVRKLPHFIPEIKGIVIALCKSRQYDLSKSIREGLKMNGEKKRWIYQSRLAGWGQRGAKILPPKKLLKMQKVKDNQNGLLHPEN